MQLAAARVPLGYNVTLVANTAQLRLNDTVVFGSRDVSVCFGKVVVNASGREMSLLRCCSSGSLSRWKKVASLTCRQV